MKKLQTLTLVLTTAIAVTACNTGPHTVISSNDNNTNTRLEYWGIVITDKNTSAIVGLSHGGSLDYKKNDQELHITDDGGGRFHYELNGNKIDQLNDEARGLLAEATAKLAKAPRGH